MALAWELRLAPTLELGIPVERRLRQQSALRLVMAMDQR